MAAAAKKSEWSCRNCDGVVSTEPKWWPTIEKASKFETSAGVCAPCFKVLMSQLKYDNSRKAVAKKAGTTKKTGKKAKK